MVGYNDGFDTTDAFDNLPVYDPADESVMAYREDAAGDVRARTPGRSKLNSGGSGRLEAG